MVLQYLNISVIFGSLYKYNVAPLSKLIKNSKILTSKDILVDASNLSFSEKSPYNLVKDFIKFTIK